MINRLFYAHIKFNKHEKPVSYCKLIKFKKTNKNKRKERKAAYLHTKSRNRVDKQVVLWGCISV